MTRVWAILAAIVGAVLGLVGLGAWWSERSRRTASDARAVGMANDRARRAAEAARGALDDAIARGEASIAAADTRAAEGVTDATSDSDLADHLLELDRDS